ncbi:MAG: prepilin peptidase [Clostridia bacterium]
MEYFFLVLGLLIGSFLNVVIYRLPLEKSIVSPGSACPSCNTRLKPMDNIPVFSFLFLKGRCRYCKAPISVRYPLIEGLTALVTVLVFLVVGLSWSLLFHLVAVYVLIAVFFIDLEHMIIPDSLVVVLLVNAILYVVIVREVPFLDAGIGFLAASLPLFLIAWATKGGLGGGDIKLMAAMGVFLGWKSILLSLLIGCVLGALVSLGLMVFKKKKKKDLIPFGPFLCMGIVIAMFYGEVIIQWYLRLSGIIYVNIF